LYLDSTIVCSAPVVDGRWSCSAGRIPDGRHAVRAVLTDAAGNYADPSEPIWVYFGPAPGNPDPPNLGAGPVPDPDAGPGTGGDTEPLPSPSPDPSGTAPPPFDPPASGGSPPPLREALTNWGTPT